MTTALKARVKRGPMIVGGHELSGNILSFTLKKKNEGFDYDITSIKYMTVLPIIVIVIVTSSPTLILVRLGLNTMKTITVLKRKA